MNIIGLCGGSGSGKTTVADRFRAIGIPVFDSDGVYHAMISRPSSCVTELAAAFGAGILDSAGGINRAALAPLVLGNDDQVTANRAKLNEITHRHVAEAFHAWCREMECAGKSTVCIDAPMLFESGIDRLCTATIAVTAPVAVRIERIVTRDGITEAEAKSRIDSQLSNDCLREKCTYAIQNDGSIHKIEQQMEQLLCEFVKRGIYHE